MLAKMMHQIVQIEFGNYDLSCLCPSCNNILLSTGGAHKMQTAVANLRAKAKYVFTQKEQFC